jgi:hypothetical protein
MSSQTPNNAAVHRPYQRRHARKPESRTTAAVLSGSPVFVDVGLYRQDSNGRIQLRGSDQTAWYLIGLIRGHWDATDSLPFRSDYSSETDFNVPAVDGAMDERDERVNMGIAIVTPFERALPLIHDAAQRMKTAQDAISDLSPDEKAKTLAPVRQGKVRLTNCRGVPTSGRSRRACATRSACSWANLLLGGLACHGILGRDGHRHPEA